MLARVRLMQMTSQVFPIGGYSHSYGLEAAVESGLVRDEETLQRWMLDVLNFSMATYELPMLNDMAAGWQSQDHAGVAELNRQFLATRESAELRAATVQMGFSLCKLLKSLPDMVAHVSELKALEEPSLPCAWSGAACAWGVEARDSAVAYAWSWAENQALVAMKCVPIGQSAAQRVLLKVGELIARLAKAEESSERSNFAPALAILSSQHETQYSRLFRS